MSKKTLVRKINEAGGIIQYGQIFNNETAQNKCSWQCTKCNKIYGYRRLALWCATVHDNILSIWIRDDLAKVGQKLRGRLELNYDKTESDIITGHFGRETKFTVVELTDNVERRSVRMSMYDSTWKDFRKVFVRVDSWK